MQITTVLIFIGFATIPLIAMAYLIGKGKGYCEGFNDAKKAYKPFSIIPNNCAETKTQLCQNLHHN
jgi:hypothetical protein